MELIRVCIYIYIYIEQQALRNSIALLNLLEGIIIIYCLFFWNNKTGFSLLFTHFSLFYSLIFLPAAVKRWWFSICQMPKLQVPHWSTIPHPKKWCFSSATKIKIHKQCSQNTYHRYLITKTSLCHYLILPYSYDIKLDSNNETIRS